MADELNTVRMLPTVRGPVLTEDLGVLNGRVRW